MSPNATRPRTHTGAAEEHLRHDARNTLTCMRLQTQLLLRLARRQDDPAWQRMVEGLVAIDAEISTLVRQLEHHDDL